MIQRDLVLTVNNDTASLNEPLIIYRHDRGITLRIKVMKYKFMFNKIMEEDLVADTSIISARAIVLKPNGTTIFECPRQAVEDDCVIINVTFDWTDEKLEVGKYKIQIQLYGPDYINERVTLPPFEFTVADLIGFVREIGVVYPPVVDEGITDGSEIEDEGAVDDDDGDLPYGIYEETVWKPGDFITAAGLNKMEDAIEYLVRTQQARALFTPSVSPNGDLSWTNDLELDNPETVNIKGDQGPQGPQGPQGEKGEDGEDGRNGKDGKDGTSMVLKGTVKTESDLNNLTDVKAGESYFCEENNNVYTWNGSEFVNCGNIKGPQGDKGDKGDSLTYEDLTEEDKADLTRGFVICNDGAITRIEVVTVYPPKDEQEYGVLYIRVSDE